MIAPSRCRRSVLATSGVRITDVTKIIAMVTVESQLQDAPLYMSEKLKTASKLSPQPV